MSYNPNTPFPNAPRVILGKFIQRSTVNNRDLKYGVELIQGVTNDGKFSKPKGSTLDIDLKPYKLVNNGAFVYNPSRLNIGSLAYRTEGFCIVSHLYIVFYLNDEGRKRINPEYLYIYFRRDEFYREVTFRNFGSQRPEFNFNDMSELEIPLPDIAVQNKYVNIYKSMVANQQSFEHGLEEIRLTFEECLDNLIKQHDSEPIGGHIELSSNTNEDLLYGIESVKGISIEKKFIDTKADMTGVNLKPYLIVAPNEFAYVTVTSRNGGKISIAFNDSDDAYLCSSSYIIFRSVDIKKLYPQYLMLFFSRSEFNRYARFHSWGSARETFDWEEMCNVRIPIPDIEVQKAIANIYSVYITRKRINEQLKAQIKNICPILIKGSIEEAKKEV